MKRIYLVIGVWCTICSIILCGDNLATDLKSVKVDNQLKMASSLEDIIPDDNFRACLTKMVTEGSGQVWDGLSESYVTLNFTINGTKYDSLTEDNLKEIQLAMCNDKGITNIQGVEKLYNLWELNLSGNNINTLTFNSSTNPNLHVLYLHSVGYQTLEIDTTISNQLDVLDVSNNNLSNDVIKQYISKFPNLYQFRTSRNNLTGELDVSSLKRLEGLWADNNQLTSIKGLADKEYTYTTSSGEQESDRELEYLVLSNNKLSSLDVSGNPGLMVLEAYGNEIGEIDLSKNTELVSLKISDNNLTNIDLTKNNKLKDINLSENLIDNVVITSDVLKYLYLSNVEFSKITINHNNPSILEILDLTNCNISNDEIQSIINRFSSVKNLSVNWNDLTTLDVSKLTNLENLNARQNNFESLDLSNNSNLTKVDLYNSSLQSLTLPSSCGRLTDLMLSVNNLKTIDLSSCTALRVLQISSNQLTALDISKNTELADLNIAFNNFDSMDLSNNSKIEYFGVDDDVVFNLDLSSLPNLKKLSTGNYRSIPIYGNTYSVDDVVNYISSYVSYESYKIYDTTDGDNNNNLVTGQSIKRDAGTRLGLRLDLVNPKNSQLSDFTGTYGYVSYYSVYFLQLTSDKYVIDETNSKIDVGGDSDDTIKSNLKIDFWSTIDIDGDKLIISFDGNPVKQFTLLRTSNPKTGEILIFVVALLGIVGALLGSFVYRKNVKNKI